MDCRRVQSGSHRLGERGRTMTPRYRSLSDSGFSPPDFRAEGERHKAEAFDHLESHREGYLTPARRAMLLRLLDVGTATADDVRENVTLPPGIDPTCFGAVPRPLAKAGIIRRTGFINTARPVAHARPVAVWELVDATKALIWLADHPDQPGRLDDDGTLGAPVSKNTHPKNTPGATGATVTPGILS